MATQKQDYSSCNYFTSFFRLGTVYALYWVTYNIQPSYNVTLKKLSEILANNIDSIYSSLIFALQCYCFHFAFVKNCIQAPFFLRSPRSFEISFLWIYYKQIFDQCRRGRHMHAAFFFELKIVKNVPSIL